MRANATPFTTPFSVLRGTRPPAPHMTIAKRSAPYGTTAINRYGKVIHRTERVLLVWRDGQAEMLARWRCGGESRRPALLNEPPDGFDSCERCQEAMPYGDQFVYYVKRDDLIKIGYTADLASRVRALKGRLLAVEPGSRSIERERHAQFAAHRVLGEWFKPAPELLDHIAKLREVAA